MRATMLVMLALTLLLGLALGWFSKGAGPVASHASNGVRGTAGTSHVLGEEGVTSTRPSPEAVRADAAAPLGPAAAVIAPSAGDIASQTALEAAALAAEATHIEEVAEDLAEEDDPAVDGVENLDEPTDERGDDQLAALPPSAATTDPEQSPEIPEAATTIPPPPAVPQPLSPGEPPAFAVDDSLDPAVFEEDAGERYVVREGDSLSIIAQRRYGELKAYRRIYEENRDRIVDPKKIYPGQTLILPKLP